MSVNSMSRVFWTNLSDLEYHEKKSGQAVKVQSSTCKIVLLAIADNANDYGENSWQSFDTIAIKTSLQKRSVVRAIRALAENNYLILDGISRYGTNNYTVNMGVLGEQPPRRRIYGGDSKSPVKKASGDSTSLPSDSRSQSSDSGSSESSLTINKPYITQKPDFVNLTVVQAASLPELRLFREATGSIPGQGQWEVVWQTVRDMRAEKKTVTADRLRPFYLAWTARGYNPRSLNWLTEWARNGTVPDNGHESPLHELTPQSPKKIEYYSVDLDKPLLPQFEKGPLTR